MKELIKLRGFRGALKKYKEDLKEKGLDKVENDAMRLDVATYNFKKDYYQKNFFRVLDKYEAQERIGLWDSRTLNGFYKKCLNVKDKGEYWVDKKLFKSFLEGFPAWYSSRNDHSIEGREFARDFREFLNYCMLEELSKGYRSSIHNLRTKEDSL